MNRVERVALHVQHVASTAEVAVVTGAARGNVAVLPLQFWNLLVAYSKYFAFTYLVTHQYTVLQAGWFRGFSSTVARSSNILFIARGVAETKLVLYS